MKKKGLVWGVIILVLLLLIGVTFFIYKQVLKNDKTYNYTFTNVSELNNFLNDINNLNYEWENSFIQLNIDNFEFNNKVGDIRIILNKDINEDATFYFTLYINGYFVPIVNNAPLMALNIELKNNMLMLIGNTGKQNQNINLYLVDFDGNILLESYDIFYEINGNLLTITDYKDASFVNCMESNFSDDDIVSEIKTYQLGYSSVNLLNSKSITYDNYCKN